MKSINTAFVTSIFIFFTLITDAHAAKIYQWVDENGKKHFSQTPPPEVKEAKKIQTSGSIASIKPVEKTDGIYCGSLRIAYKDRRYNASTEHRITSSYERWSANLKRSEERLQQHMENANNTRTVKNGEYVLRNSTRYTQTKERLTKQINEYRCALGWTSSGSSSPKDSARSSYDIAKNNYDDAVAQLEKNCGKEPEKIEGNSLSISGHSEWYSCQRKYSRTIRNLKRKLSTAEREYSKYNK